LEVIQSSLEGVLLFQQKVFEDPRGYFAEIYKTVSFSKDLPVSFVQDNLSLSHRGVVRGLHLQKNPMAQGKLVRCLKGRIWDVALDLRPQSKTFQQWTSYELSEENHSALYIPPGFAHGFQALEENTLVFYKCTELYSKGHEVGLRFDDKTLGIPWPLPPSELSEKDQKLPTLQELLESDLIG